MLMDRRVERVLRDDKLLVYTIIFFSSVWKIPIYIFNSYGYLYLLTMHGFLVHNLTCRCPLNV